jgi:putative transposase
VIGRSYEAVRQWYHRLAHLFDPEPDHYLTIAIDETKLKVEDTEVYVWAAIDVEAFEVVPIKVSPRRSDLDALLFIKQVLKCCRGDPIVLVDRGPWYNWPLDDLCESRRETWEGGTVSRRSVARPAEIPNQALLQPGPPL